MSMAESDSIYFADEHDFEDEFAFWPLNLVLVLLGATILGVAFTYLDPVDNRLLYNPWTYVVVTPIVLMLLSVILSTIVSRIVAKSMQMAFLLSVLVHLFMLVGAMNVVIFSHLWPQILESMANERQQLERREKLQAPQYHRIASTTQTGTRPDYLAPVPTEHQPTELELADTTSLKLTRSTRDNLVSPEPRVELSNNPHLTQRDRPSPAMPSIRDSAASLSRSELQQRVRNQSQPRSFDLPSESMTPPELQPSAAAKSGSRSRASESPSRLALEPLSTPELQQPSPSLSRLAEATRREQSEPTSASAAETLHRLERAQSLARGNTSQPIRSSSISVPELSSVAEAATAESLNAASEVTALQRESSSTARRRRTELNNVESTLADLSRNSLQPELTMPKIRRDDPVKRIPDASIGEFSAALSRSTAGGEAGMAAPASMPIQGVEGVGVDQPSPSQLNSPRLSASRRSRSRSSSTSSLSGESSAPAWNGQSSLANGVSGQSPAEIARAASDGNAASDDAANLSGDGRTLARSRTGIEGLTGALSGPQAPIGIAAIPSESGESSALSASSGDNERSRRRRGRDSSVIDPLQMSTVRAGATSGSEAVAGFNTLADRAERQVDSADSGEGTSRLFSSNFDDSEVSRTKSEYQGTSPSSSSIQIPDSAIAQSSGGEADSDTQLGWDALARSDLDGIDRDAPGGRRNRRDSSGPTNLLALNAAPGMGGLSPTPDVAGDLLPRRNQRGEADAPTDLEIQRFARQDVGGPLAAGQIAIPKPAFQQRLDRLKDRNAMDATTAEPQTELAIERGLEFLARNQRSDGSWRLQDFDSQVLMTSDTAATGLALLAFQGAGYTHKNFKYAEVCDRAIQFLRQHQKSDGDLYIPQNPASDQNAWLYSHGIAAIAMCEAYGMTQDPEIQEAAQRAVDFITTSQDKARGGWRYRPGAGSDTSVSGWYMMALQSARLAGLEVNAQTLQRLEAYLQLSQSPDGKQHLYRYNPYAANTPQQRHGLEPTAVMTSVGLLMRLYTGWDSEHAGMQKGADFLLQHLPEEGTVEQSKRDTYYWYYATQVMFHIGGNAWEQWHDALYPQLIRNQVVDGPYQGSWDPVTPTPDLWARYGGRLYVTTMNLLSLEVTYRHLPIYHNMAMHQGLPASRP